MNRFGENHEKTLRIAVRRFGPFETALQKQWQCFEQRMRTGFELDAIPLDLEPLHRLLFEQRGLDRGECDLALVSTDWLSEANESGGLMDLSPLLASAPPEGYPGAWSESLLRLQSFDSRVLGLPYHDGPECLIYRRDLFDCATEQQRFLDQYGEPLHVPRTWSDFRRVARFFTRPGEDLYGTVFAGYPDGHNTVYDFCLQLWSRGGQLFDAEQHILLDTEEAVAALEYYRSLCRDAGAMHPAYASFDSVKSGLAFAAGEIAMMVNWFGFAAMSETIEESKVKGKTAIAAIPSDQGHGISLNAYWVMGIAAGSPHADVAWKFLCHCAGAEMDKLLTLEGGIGCRKSTWADEQVNATIPYYHRLAQLHENARELPRLSNWSRLAAVLDSMVLDVMQTGEPIASITKRAQERASKVPLAGVVK